MVMSALVFIASALQFSRQNLVASIFLLWSPIRKNKILVFLAMFTSVLIITFVDLTIVAYLKKAYLQYTGVLPSTRLDWFSLSINLIDDNILIPNFIKPVDNTAITILLQFGFVSGLAILLLSLIAWIRLTKISFPLAMSFLVLFFLNDIHFEASYWFIIFCMLSDHSFRKVSEYQSVKMKSFQEKFIDRS